MISVKGDGHGLASLLLSLPSSLIKLLSFVVNDGMLGHVCSLLHAMSKSFGEPHMVMFAPWEGITFIALGVP